MVQILKLYSLTGGFCHLYDLTFNRKNIKVKLYHKSWNVYRREVCKTFSRLRVDFSGSRTPGSIRFLDLNSGPSGAFRTFICLLNLLEFQDFTDLSTLFQTFHSDLIAVGPDRTMSAILAIFQFWQNGTFETVHEIQKIFCPKDFFWSNYKKYR